jgi:hypothetical protein
MLLAPYSYIGFFGVHLESLVGFGFAYESSAHVVCDSFFHVCEQADAK